MTNLLLLEEEWGILLNFPARQRRVFQKIPQFARIKIETALKSFAENSYGHHDVVRIKGSPKDIPSYRIRAGEYRASFVIWHDIMIVFVFDVGKKENYEYR